MLRDQLEYIKGAAEKNFISSGNLMPVFISDLGGGFSIMPLMWHDASDKENFSAHLKNWISNGEVTEYIMVAEAWALKKDVKESVSEVNDWIRENGSLEKHPERTEVIMIQYCSASEETDIFCEIKRDGENVSLGEWFTRVNRNSMKVNPMGLSSRFGNVFAKSSANLN